jgi:hypothetical protein
MKYSDRKPLPAQQSVDNGTDYEACRQIRRHSDPGNQQNYEKFFPLPYVDDRQAQVNSSENQQYAKHRQGKQSDNIERMFTEEYGKQ